MAAFFKAIIVILRNLIAAVCAVVITLAIFMLLPVLQHIAKAPQADTELRTVEVAALPPPPAPEIEEPTEEPEQEEEPPKLNEQDAPLDLAQLELALNPGLGGGGGDFAVKLDGGQSVDRKEAEAVFSLEDLDQAPRVSRQVAPEYPSELRRKKLSGTVYIIFIVSKQGRVEQAKVQKSTNPAFDAPALKAPVQFRMRVPITQ